MIHPHDVDDEKPLVEMANVDVTFGSQRVLRDISFKLPRGQTLALIGESGCGKSVLMKTIIGLIRPNRGTVHFDSQDVAKLTDAELTRERVRFGYVFQNAALFDSMTVGQNVAFPLRQHGKRSDDEIRKTVFERLAEVGLPDVVAVKKPAELSGGMRKRVGLARALALAPELMLYDEPTTGLDPIMSDVINELILRTRRNNPITSIVVTHDMHTARKVAVRVVILYPASRLAAHESQIIFDGSPTELDRCKDRRVTQFVRGEAGERLMELRQANAAATS